MPEYRFDEIAILRNEKRTPVPEDKYTYVGLEHLDSGKLEVTRWGSEVDIKGEKLVMHKGDILFGRRNTYLKRAAIAPHDGLFSAHGMIFRPNTKVISERLFPFFIASDYFMDAAIRISVGSLSPTVNWKTLRELKFKLPPLEQQNELADLMQAANDTKVAYEQILLQIDELVKSQFIEMFGGVKNSAYPLSKVKDIATVRVGIVIQPTKYYSADSSGVKVFRSANVRPFYVEDSDWAYFTVENHELMSKTHVHTGDVLIVRSGANLGQSCVVPQKYNDFNAIDVLIVTPNTEKVRSDYVCAFVNFPIGRGQILSGQKGIAQKHLNVGVFENALIPVPPMNIQKAFCVLVEQTDKSKFELKQAIERVTNLMKSLMQQDFAN